AGATTTAATTTRSADTPTTQANANTNTDNTNTGARGLGKLVIPPHTPSSGGAEASSLSSDVVSPLEEAVDCWNMEFEFQLGSPVSPLSPRPGSRIRI